VVDVDEASGKTVSEESGNEQRSIPHAAELVALPGTGFLQRLHEAHAERLLVAGGGPIASHESSEQVDEIKGRALAGGEMLAVQCRFNEVAEEFDRRTVMNKRFGHSPPIG